MKMTGLECERSVPDTYPAVADPSGWQVKGGRGGVDEAKVKHEKVKEKYEK
jgi:hypothetical protein